MIKENTMKEIIQYLILEDKSASELERKVAEHIDNGWYPLGGVSMCSDETANCFYYAQAMVEYKEEIT